MIKFFKEIIESIKEGIAEAKEEIEAENNNISKPEQAIELINNIPYDEAFGTSLAAIFRITFFGYWASSFSDTKYPVNLYQFGNNNLSEKQKKTLSNVLNRDFGIHNSETSLQIIYGFFKCININTVDIVLDNNIPKQIDLEKWNNNKTGFNAVIISVITHIICGSCDIKYINKELANKLLFRIHSYAKNNYSDWKTFSDDFLIGDKEIGLNNKLGRSVIKKHIETLLNKETSPWNTVKWEKENQQTYLKN